jgi:hypothetical protein
MLMSIDIIHALFRTWKQPQYTTTGIHNLGLLQYVPMSAYYDVVI